MNWEGVLVPMVRLVEDRLQPLNPSAVSLLGPHGARLDEVLPPVEQARWHRTCARAERAGRPVWYEAKLRLGERREVVVQVGVTAGGGGGALLTLIDVTRERQRGARSERSSRFLQGLLDRTPTLFFVIDRSGLLVFRNAAFTRFVGSNTNVVSAATTPQLSERFHQSLVHLFDDGTEARFRLEGRDAMGATSHLQLTLQPIEDDRGRVHQALGVGVDLTDLIAAHGEQRRLQRELELAQRLEVLGQMVGTIAHDFNGFLTVVNSSAFMLMDEPLAQDQETKELVEIILEVVRKAQDMTQDLLAFSRSQVHSLQRSSARDVVKGLVSTLPRLVPETVSLTVVQQLDEARLDWLVPLSESQCMQIVVNLVNNATEAVAERGEVEVTIQLAEQALKVVVEDDGPGVPDDVRARIFEPFFTTRQGSGGTGLGLSSAMSLVQRVGGSVRLSSPPGEGARFVVKLPLSEVTATA